jgi:hypothetical protein
VDPTSGEVTETFEVDLDFAGLAVGADTVWVSGTRTGVVPIDAATGEVGPLVPVGDAIQELAALGDSLWVASSNDDRVYRISS